MNFPKLISISRLLSALVVISV